MENVPRYEIIDRIAQGDFAAVYRARDRELGREVAIKQIHPQFLADERQLARYWQEAQLLAKLQHPHILTIYDIVRSRGWLILELMRSSLQPATQGEGIDLAFLRKTLAGTLSALHFLHMNGVLHGDIKPSNLLIDSQGFVKLGDFGLARRASNEEGSLLKGTTKYMAPELLAPQLGAVGPASDLYSLGFTAYELLCGRRFEELFPGLSAFGRDRQIAWMMWHAAPDRRLPPINRVLQGVPEDLMRTIERMIAKNPADRYPSAADALADLNAPQTTLPLVKQPDPAEEAARLAAERTRKRKRLLAYSSVAASILLCLVLFWPASSKQPVKKDDRPRAGLVTNVYPDERKIEFRLPDNGPLREMPVSFYDKVFINDKTHSLRDLKPEDQLTIKYVIDEQKRAIKEIYASRPDSSEGIISRVDPAKGLLVLGMEEGSQKKELEIEVPASTAITLNGEKQASGKPLDLSALRAEDRIVVLHRGQGTSRQAVEIDALRDVTSEGVLSTVSADGKKITFDAGKEGSPRRITLEVAASPTITLNNLAKVNDRFLVPSDLKPGDRVQVVHDLVIRKISAFRILGQEGIISEIQYNARTLHVLLEGAKDQIFAVNDETNLTLEGEETTLDALRPGDLVDITHNSLEGNSPLASAINARRPSDPQRWALLISTGEFDDSTLTPLPSVSAAAGELKESLQKRYKVPSDQIFSLVDESLVRLEQGIPERLGRITEEGKLFVYYGGRAVIEGGKAFLTPKNFDAKRPASGGLSFQWLIDELEKCPAKEKVLLLDVGYPDSKGSDPSAAELMATLRTPPNRGALKTITAIGGTNKGEKAVVADKKPLFADLVQKAFDGEADKNRDTRLEPTELFDFLNAGLTQHSPPQTPRLYLPDDRPPRLSDEAKTAIRQLAASLAQERVQLDALQSEYDTASQLAGSEIEPKLVWYMLTLKDVSRRDESMKLFLELKNSRPDLLLSYQGIAWLYFNRPSPNYRAGLNELIEGVSHVPSVKPGEKLPLASQIYFYFCGQMREYSALGPEERSRPPADILDQLDQAIARQSSEAGEFYKKGRDKSAERARSYDQQIAEAKDESHRSVLRIEHRRLINYLNFPYNTWSRIILSGLDQ